MEGFWKLSDEEKRFQDSIRHLPQKERIRLTLESFTPTTPELEEAFEESIRAVQEAREASLTIDLSA